MKLETIPDENREAAQPRASRESPSGSFLLRVWTESREVDGEPPSVRVFLRNLKTGEEHYLGELDQLGDAVLKQFKRLDESS
jgi:hypothetical protein